MPSLRAVTSLLWGCDVTLAFCKSVGVGSLVIELSLLLSKQRATLGYIGKSREKEIGIFLFVCLFFLLELLKC